jgi:hypothetical protein
MEGIEAVPNLARNCNDASIRLAAWKLLFERGYGKALTQVNVQHSFAWGGR